MAAPQAGPSRAPRVAGSGDLRLDDLSRQRRGRTFYIADSRVSLVPLRRGPVTRSAVPVEISLARGEDPEQRLTRDVLARIDVPRGYHIAAGTLLQYSIKRDVAWLTRLLRRDAAAAVVPDVCPLFSRTRFP